MYEYSKLYLSNKWYGSYDKMNLLIYSTSATFSAVTCDIITNPLWVIRLRFQTEFLHSQAYVKESFNLFKEMRKIVQKVI